MALPYPIPDPATGDWNAFALKRNLEYLDTKIPPLLTSAVGIYHNSHWTGVATGANTTETIINSFALPANTLDTANDMLDLTTIFRTAGNANTKRVRVYLGSTAIADTGAVALNGQNGLIRVLLFRLTSTSETAFADMTWSTDGAAGTPTRLTTVISGTEDLRSALLITVTGQNGSPSAGDLVVYGTLVLKYPARG